MLRNLSAVVLFAATLSAMSGGCSSSETSCTMLGCPAEFQVNFARQAWAAGSYRIVTTIDGFESSCDVTLPFADCQTECQLSASPGRGDVFLLQSGCALGSSEHRLDGVLLSEIQPKEVGVEVLFEGTSLGKASFTPTYERSVPNGEECEPVCMTAPSETLSG